MPAPVLNIAAYKFVPLPDAATLRQAWRAPAERHGLRGTILLAEEGINLFLAGVPQEVEAFVDEVLRADPRLADLQLKRSFSTHVPFERLKLRLKREIIRMDRPTIRPAAGRAPAVAPATLARWLDAGRDDAGREVVLVDTRNAFELDHGRFRGALDWGLQRFGDFPAALEAHVDELRDKTVVSYCTGGIRCEKAALLMREQGLPHALQLDGGILGYFEQVGRRHFDGDCFVFDERVALDPALRPSA